MSEYSRLQKAIIFDLDGTLIDSAYGVLSCLRYAFKKAGIAPCVRLDRTIIGPCLPELIGSVTNSLSASTLSIIEDTFIERYDQYGHLDADPYVGIQKLIEDLFSENTPMYIATNKRYSPTLQIVKRLGWEKIFDQVYSLDSPYLAAKDKSDLLHLITNDLNIVPSNCLYIGDTTNDFMAAGVNNMRFALASWGYDKLAAKNISCPILVLPPRIEDLMACF